MQSYAKFVRDRSGGLISVRFRRLFLKYFYNAVFGFLSVLYVLSVCFTAVARKTFLNVFYNVILELVLALVVSGAGLVLPQLLPVRSRVIPGGLCCLTLILSDHAGRRSLYWFTGRSVPDRLKVLGIAPGRNENTKEMYDKSEAASKPGRFELEKSEKNRRNLRLIQTCDFFILCILYINSYNVPRSDVNFYFITFNSSFPVVFFLLVISEILLLRLFCRLVSLFLRFADSLLMVPMPTPF